MYYFNYIAGKMIPMAFKTRKTSNLELILLIILIYCYLFHQDKFIAFTNLPIQKDTNHSFLR